MKCKLLVIRNVFNLSDTSKLAEFFTSLLILCCCTFLSAAICMQIDYIIYIISTARISNSFFMALKQFTE